MPSKPVWKKVQFRLLFKIQFLGAFNDNFFKNALFLLIIFSHYSIFGLSSDKLIALGGGLFILPFFLFSAFAGELGDQYCKKNLIFYIKIWELIIMSFALGAFYFKSFELLLCLLFLTGMQSTFFGPLKYSILPEIVDGDQLVAANGFIEMGTFLSILLGTILGGLLVSIAGDYSRVIVGVTVVAISLFGLQVSHQLKKGSKFKKKETQKSSQGVLRVHLNLWKVCRESKLVWSFILLISWFWCMGTILLSIFPVYVEETLFATSSVATMLLAIFSIGIGVGNILCEKLIKKFGLKNIMLTAVLGLSLFSADLFVLGEPIFFSSEKPRELLDLLGYLSFWRILMDLLFLAISGGVFIVPLYAGLQKFGKPQQLSSVIAGNNIINAFFMVLGSLALIALYELGLKKHDIYLILSLLNIIVCIFVYFIYSQNINEYLQGDHDG